ncbi:hypothetical protein GcC1_188013 [Golovinomyces cichoracearum]|uniref:Uncharacterized protein n=1 Tax=Golovinomyces cichoracearum TaxID=62708 RepID=A0A420HJH4_9PEZI|nr:hypothetical protein GcC1_188013 [Golovinomyces cichoracearum]
MPRDSKSKTDGPLSDACFEARGGLPGPFLFRFTDLTDWVPDQHYAAQLTRQARRKPEATGDCRLQRHDGTNGTDHVNRDKLFEYYSVTALAMPREAKYLRRI